MQKSGLNEAMKEGYLCADYSPKVELQNYVLDMASRKSKGLRYNKCYHTGSFRRKDADGNNCSNREFHRFSDTNTDDLDIVGHPVIVG